MTTVMVRTTVIVVGSRSMAGVMTARSAFQRMKTSVPQKRGRRMQRKQNADREIAHRQVNQTIVGPTRTS